MAQPPGRATPRPVMLVILDGFGWREEAADNAVRQARTPTFTKLWQTCPHAFLHTSGRDVGLPDVLHPRSPRRRNTVGRALTC